MEVPNLKIDVETKSLDEAIEKVQQLNNLLEQVKSSIVALNENKLKVVIKTTVNKIT
jgi:hypothetical protein